MAIPDLGKLSAALRDALTAVDDVKAGNAERLARAREAVETARRALAVAIVAAYVNGDRTGEIATATGYGREQVRRILRANGVEPRED